MANKKGFGYSFGLDPSDFSKGCKSVQQMMDKTFGKNLMNLSKGALTAFAGISAAIAGIGAAAMKMGEKLDSALTGLQGIWGSAQKATEQYERLRNISENSMFGIDALTAVDKKLSLLGVRAEESATILTRLGNTVVASNGTTQNLEALANALTQIKITGKVSAKSLSVFAEAGIKIDDLIGGSASNAVNTLIERMKKFDGVMAGESTDIWIQYKRVVKIAEDALAKLGNYINDNFKEYVVVVVDKISKLRDAFVNLLNDKDGMSALTKHIEIFAGVLTAVALPAMARMAIGFLPVIASAASLIGTITALTLIMEDLFSDNSIIINGFKKIQLTFKWLGAQVREETGNLLEQVYMSVANTFIDIANYGIDSVNFLLKGIEKLLNSAFRDFKQELTNLMSDLSVMAANMGLEDLSQKFGKTADSIQKGFSVSFGEISKITRVTMEEAKEAMDLMLGDSVESVENELDEVDQKVEKSVNNIKEKIKEAYEYVQSFFSTSINRTDDEASILVSGGKTIGQSDNNEGDTTDLWARLKEAAKECYSTIKEEFIKAYDAFCEYQKKIEEQKKAFQNWSDGIKKTLNEGLQQSFNNAINSSGNFFQTLGNSLKKLGEQILKQIGQMVLLTALFRMCGIKSGTISGVQTVLSWKEGRMNDGIVQNGRIITTHPDDYIIATKTPETLGGGGRANVVVNVTNNSNNEVTTDSYFDGTKEIINIMIDGISRNVSGSRDFIRAI